MPPYSSQKKESRVLYTVVTVVVLVVIGLMAYGYQNQSNSKSSKVPATTGAQSTVPEKTKEKVSVQQTNTNTSSPTKTPVGFPSFITISPSAKITESYKAAFPERKVTQYTVGFTSTESFVTVSDFYKNLAKQNGFAVTSSTNTDNSRSLYTTKDNNDFSITVTKSSSGSTATISYLERQK